jgi:uncharacterized DUF497 family protein
MKFEWDENKNDSNVKKHGIDFQDAKNIFEQRFVSFGIMYGHVIAVVHLETEEVIRIISARKATKNEQKEYFKQVPH